MNDEIRKTSRLLLAGLAAAEGLGSSSEFVPTSQIPALYAKLKHKGWPFKQLGGGPFNWKPGQATDDGDQALCLIRSYFEMGRFDPEDVGKRLVAWMNSGPRDIGGTTARTLGMLKNGTPWHEAGLKDHLADPNNAANGSLMRNGVVAGLMIGEDLNALFRATVQHSIITHAHPLAVLCCAVHSWLIADELAGWEQGCAYNEHWFDDFYEDWTEYVQQEQDPHVGKWLDKTRGRFQEAGAILTDADFDPFSFNPFETDFAGRSGYCLLTLQVAVWALCWSKLDEPFPTPSGLSATLFQRRESWVMAWPALVGQDADTTGAVTGALLAAAHGSVPEDLTEGLSALAVFDAMG